MIRHSFIRLLLATVLAPLALFAVSCLAPTDPTERGKAPPNDSKVEEPCFIADTVGRSAEIDARHMPCWLWIYDCTVQQVCVSKVR
ncbi:hypothetical protein LCGC14_2140760 [marine sediment metagenome]|uniref:Uncharacterized protein n=1 Tax=marine sediment metagenome TaxID=412755 RepID=A0A0F9EKS4_9ZZZZ